MIKKKGLGRGLEALLGANEPASPATPSGTPSLLPLGVLQAGKYQPRTRMDEGALNELADSIRTQGLMQPILVRSINGGRYEIIAGERRFRAAAIAGLTEVPVLVRDVPDESAAVMALIENIQRAASDHRIQADARAGCRRHQPLTQRHLQSVASAQLGQARADHVDGR